MQSQSFADLGVSRPVVAALAERGIHEPFAIQQPRHRRRARRPRRARQVPHRLGQDARVRDPDRRAPRGRRPRPRRARARADARARRPDRRAVPAARPRPRARGRGRLRRRRLREADQGVQARRHPRRHARPPRGPDGPPRRRASTASRSSSSTRPTGCSTWASARPSTGSSRACPRDRQTLFFSATLDGEAGRIAGEYTHDAVAPRARAGAGRRRRRSSTASCRSLHEDKLAALVAELSADRGLTLVFVRTKRGADRLVKRLGREGVDAVAMHGDKSQSQREKALARFESGKIDTLVATDVAARGIHVTGISHVINFDPPEDREGYVHRVGRTGRAGRTGVGITFVNADQAGDVGKIAAASTCTRSTRAPGFSRSRAAPPRPHASRRRRLAAARSALPRPLPLEPQQPLVAREPALRAVGRGVGSAHARALPRPVPRRRRRAAGPRSTASPRPGAAGCRCSACWRRASR